MTENNFQIDSAAISDKGLSKKRPNNEDSFAELNQQGLFVVADGVGGAQAGDVASQMAVEVLSEAFLNLEKNSDAEDMMKLAIERGNESIFQMSHDLEQLSTMATTIVALHVSGNIATIGHVGDSRLYRLDEKGNLFRETQDHSVVEEEVRAGRMTEAQALNHPSRNVISRALGADSAVDIDMKTIMFEPHTTFFLCSDGITRHISDPELRELLKSDEEPANIARKMKEICYERGAEDNLTAVIARVTDKIVGADSGEFEGNSLKFEQTPISTEEPTRATARTFDDSNFTDSEEIATQQLQMPESAASQMEVYDALEKNPEQQSFRQANDYVFSDAALEKKDSNLEEIKTESIAKVKENSGLSKFLIAAMLFLIGLFIGAGITYAYTKTHSTITQVPPAPAEDSPDIPYTAFEDNRRNVDENPELYIKNSENAENKDAEDFYLLGRAYLLTLNMPKAKESFEESRRLLNEPNAADKTNIKTLKNEIAMSLTLINNPFTPKILSDELNNAGDNENTNVNSGENANSQIQPQN